MPGNAAWNRQRPPAVESTLWGRQGRNPISRAQFRVVGGNDDAVCTDMICIPVGATARGFNNRSARRHNRRAEVSESRDHIQKWKRENDNKRREFSTITTRFRPYRAATLSDRAAPVQKWSVGDGLGGFAARWTQGRCKTRPPTSAPAIQQVLTHCSNVRR